MATVTVTPGYNWVSGEVVTPAKMNLAAAPTASLSAIVNADVADGAAIALSKLATGALPTAITVASANLVDGTIVNADISATAAIAGSKLADAAITAAKLDGAQTGSAPIYGCRAWVNFDGTDGSTVDGEFRCTIRASGNVSKVVRVANAEFDVHFSTPMEDGYSISFGATQGNGRFFCIRGTSLPTANKFTMFYMESESSARINPPYACAQVFR